MKLKPCPFCGSEKLIMHRETNAQFRDFVYVGCLGCHCSGPPSFGDSQMVHQESLNDIIEKEWNKRKVMNEPT